MNTTEFWKLNIKSWSLKNYNRKNSAISLRAQLAAKLLIDNNIHSIVDIGCGLGHVFKFLPVTYRRECQYAGYDVFSPELIDIEDENFIYHQRDISSLNNNDVLPTDCVLSLGLIDWLTDSELEKIVSLSKDRLFLHSFTIRKFNLKFVVYITYRFLLNLFLRYPVPSLYKVEEISQKFSAIESNTKIIKGPYLVHFITNMSNV
ncbi:MAG: class I SAM-dependent methyltransferase [Bacteriovoracaceae bacterium]|nr:class I SAM-dependent methyltransferase [Bacteriovoracaceae bacterium]